MPILWLFPVTVFLTGSQLPFKFWYTRQKQFRINAAGSVLSSFPISVAEIIGGSAGFRAGGDLVVCRVFGHIFLPTFYVWRLLRGDLRFIIRNINAGGILRSAKKYIKFPVFDTGSVLLTVLSMQAPIFLLTSFFSPAICGLYAKASYLLLFPSIIIGQSVTHVFLQESAAAKAARMNLAGLFETVFNRMITIGTLPFAILAIIGPELFELFLGARWIESGVFTQILTPQIFLVFLLGSKATYPSDINEKMVKAAMEGDTAAVVESLAKGADVNAKGRYSGWTPLILAAKRGETELVNFLLSYGADVNEKSDVRNRTAIMEAARNRKVETVKALLTADPDIDAVDWEGYTVLMFAAVSGQSDIVDVLLTHGADVNVKNKVGSSALTMASGYPNVLKKLKAAGAEE